MGHPRFEPEAAGDGQVDVSALSVPRPTGTQTESCDVKVERSVWDFLKERGSFLRASTSSTEDDYSIVSLQALFSDLLLLRWFRRVLFFVVRCFTLSAEAGPP